MKKILNVIFAAVLALLIVVPVNAQETLTVEKGTYLEVGNADRVDIYNELNSAVWKNMEIVNGSVLIPKDNPLQTVYVHIYKGDEKEVIKCTLTEPHEHKGQYVEFIRPTDTEAGKMEYFFCNCGKYFEDRECTKEITEDIDEWSYIAPVPKEEWNGPVAVVERYDGKQVTDSTKPNPTWTEEEVNNYYEKEEIEIKAELVDRAESKEANDVIESNDDVIETNEVIEPVTFAVQPVEEPTLWEKIKLFFAELFN